MATDDDVNLVPVKTGKSRFALVLIVLLLLMTGAAGFFAWQYFSGSPATASSVNERASEDPETAAEGEQGDPDENGEGGNQSTVLNFEPFLVNLADRDVSRYLRVTLKLEVATKTAADRIASEEVLTSQIRDSIIGTLSTKVADEIITYEGKEQLKIEIASKLNEFLPGKPIKAVYFTDFVVQI